MRHRETDSQMERKWSAAIEGAPNTDRGASRGHDDGYSGYRVTADVHPVCSTVTGLHTVTLPPVTLNINEYNG